MQAESDRQVSAFLRHIRFERQLSRHTVDAYRRDLNALKDYCIKRTLPSWAALAASDLRRFAAGAHRRGLAPRTVPRRPAGARSFVNFPARESQLAPNRR